MTGDDHATEHITADMHRPGEPPRQPVGHRGLTRRGDTRHEENTPFQIGHICNQSDTSLPARTPATPAAPHCADLLEHAACRLVCRDCGARAAPSCDD